MGPSMSRAKPAGVITGEYVSDACLLARSQTWPGDEIRLPRGPNDVGMGALDEPKWVTLPASFGDSPPAATSWTHSSVRSSAVSQARRRRQYDVRIAEHQGE